MARTKRFPTHEIIPGFHQCVVCGDEMRDCVEFRGNWICKTCKSNVMEEEAINKIAKEILELDTLRLRNGDWLDNHTLHVDTLHRALVEAFREGQEAGK